jgi:hypothetical protein
MGLTHFVFWTIAAESFLVLHLLILQASSVTLSYVGSSNPLPHVLSARKALVCSLVKLLTLTHMSFVG